LANQHLAPAGSPRHRARLRLHLLMDHGHYRVGDQERRSDPV